MGTGERTLNEPIPEEQFKAFIRVTVNEFYNKWRHRIRTAKMQRDEWDVLILEADRIVKQGRQYPVVSDIVFALVQELSREAINLEKN
jgi:hypothetical protein